jgi:tRNA threonylcarbamoyladenosine biosynthesis protein TsaE
MAAAATPPAPVPPGEPACEPLVDAAATRELGRRLALTLLPGCRRGHAPLLLLRGDLGAGKTCLVQGLAEELGIAEPITSPSFALAQHYDGQLRDGRATGLVHLDLYRLEAGPAADELFAQEEEEAQALAALMAIEWPERLTTLPADAWLVELELRDPNRPEAGRLARIRTSPQGRAWPARPGPVR